MSRRDIMRKALLGERTNQIVLAPRLEIWYEYHKHNNSLPAQYRGLSMRDIERQLGVVHPGRKGRVYKEKINKVKVLQHVSGDKTTYVYDTPYGALTETYMNHPREGRISQTEHLWKSTADYRPLKYLIENIEYEPAYEEFIQYDEWVGADGVPFVSAGEDPFYELMRYYMGFENVYFELVDNRREFTSLFETLLNKKLELQELVVRSPGEFVIHGAHYDTPITPPHLYREFIGPYLADFSQKLHRVGKRLVIHADADLSGLLTDVLNSGVDVAECFCCFPMVQCRLRDAMEAWKGRIIIWGGVPSTLLVPEAASLETLDQHLEDVDAVLAEFEYKGLILGIADNIMPEADFGRMEYIVEWVNRRNADLSTGTNQGGLDG